jgi:trk system potassium uptake protein
MKDRFIKIKSILHYLGWQLEVLAVLMLFPVICVCWYWQRSNEGWTTVCAFALPALASYLTGHLLKRRFKETRLDSSGALIMCALGWLIVAAFGAVPFYVGTQVNVLDAYFESVSGFTTTGITVYSGLNALPRSILLWRALSQWLGGIGILSFFLVATLSASGAHHIYAAESHKIASSRPVPGLMGTVKILWTIYAGFTMAAWVSFACAGMGLFDSMCHALTAVSTGGFSPHDSSLAYYRINNYPHYRLIEYLTTFFMLLGGINFIIHYQVMTGRIKALWDNAEMRCWWRLLGLFSLVIALERLHQTGQLGVLAAGQRIGLQELEEIVRTTVFQVISIITTSGFAINDIGGEYYGTAAKQLFLVMMVIGGCAGSTSGGFKVMRIVILQRLMRGELFRARISSRASSGVVIDGRIVSDIEIQRVAGLFMAWIVFLIVGGSVTALFSRHGAYASFSGMFSAVGNIGPCFISVNEMSQLHPVVKITYIAGMLAGRLEILPVLLLFSRKAWQ